MVVLAFLAARHLATSPWPLSGGQPGVLVAVCLLLLLAQGFKAWGWGRLFAADERPRLLALAAGNGGAALTGVVLPGRFDDAMRVAVVRRDPGCRAGVRALCLSLVMLGLIDSVALAPLAAAAAVLVGGGIGVRTGLTVVAVAGVAAAGLLVALPRLAGSPRGAGLGRHALAHPQADVCARAHDRRRMAAGLRARRWHRWPRVRADLPVAGIAGRSRDLFAGTVLSPAVASRPGAPR